MYNGSLPGISNKSIKWQRSQQTHTHKNKTKTKQNSPTEKKQFVLKKTKKLSIYIAHAVDYSHASAVHAVCRNTEETYRNQHLYQ